jgi:surfactin synthase thioesterase subunit
LDSEAADEWFVSVAPHPEARITIAAFPQAGGGCATFAQHTKAMPGWLELATLNLPGRQARFAEPLRTDIDTLTTELAEYWAKRADDSLFFGYCSGAMLAYCTACKLQEYGANMPRRLIIGAYKAPHLTAPQSLADLDSQTLWRVLIDNHVVAPEFAVHSELRSLIEAVVRGDLALIAGYRHAERPPLRVPITVLVGDRDDWISPDQLSAWARYTTQAVEVKQLPTGHWFMEEDPAISAQALIAEASETRVL